MARKSRRSGNRVKIVFIADYFAEQINGGGELNNKELINILKQKEHQVRKINSHLLNPAFIRGHYDKGFKFVVANFVNLKQDCKDELLKTEYIIYEHDHKYLANRDPGIYPSFLAPKEAIINHEFYKEAKAVLCQSSFHADIIKKNLEIDNLINLSGNLWSVEHLDLLEEMSKIEKIDEHAIMNSVIPHKNTHKAILYCKNKELKYKLINQNSPINFLKELGKYKALIFFPKTPETLSRIIVEARMMGLSTKTTKNIGAIHEPWFIKKGPDLINIMRKKREDITDLVLFSLNEEPGEAN